MLTELAAAGYRGVEPYGESYGLTPQQFRGKLDGYGLHAVSRHDGVDEGSFDAEIAEAKTIGQEYMGNGGTPGGWGGSEETLQTAAAAQPAGQALGRGGRGQASYIHNHAGEFTTKHIYEGEQTSVWEILIQETDKRYVSAQIDVYWAWIADADIAALLEKYPDRDRDRSTSRTASRPATTGPGRRSARATSTSTRSSRPRSGKVRWYHMEIDPPGGWRADGEAAVKNWLQKSIANVGRDGAGHQHVPAGLRHGRGRRHRRAASGSRSRTAATRTSKVSGVTTRGADYDSAGDFLVGEETCTDGAGRAAGDVQGARPLRPGAGRRELRRPALARRQHRRRRRAGRG